MKKLTLVSKTFKTFAKGEKKKELQKICVKDRHLVAELENAWAGGSRFERVGSQMLKGNGQIGFPLRNLFVLIFLTPQCTFGTKKAQKAHTGTPSKKVLFQKT